MANRARCTRRPISYKNHRFPPQIIAHAVWLYFRFPLSLRLVEEMLLEWGIVVPNKTIRRWGRSSRLRTILIASSGQEAIDLLEGDASLFAVVTDGRLGTGPSGWDVAHLARELTPTMPVIYITEDSANLWSAYGVPSTIVLQKPFVEAQLITAIATLLNQASTTGTTFSR